jgi:hypothetical protein
MVSQRDWEIAQREVIERGRARAGDPPTAEQVAALARGKLSDTEADEVRERLAYYPELAAALAEDDDAAQDQPPMLTPADLAADWELLQQRISPAVRAHVAAAQLPAAPPRRSWLMLLPVASTILFAGLYAATLVTNSRLREDLNRPQGQLERMVLLENTSRGPAATRPLLLRPTTRSVLLVLTVLDDIRTETARATIRDLDTKPPRAVWSGTISRVSDGTYPLIIPRSFLTSQTYQVELAADGRVVATYQFWLSNDDSRAAYAR